MESFARAILFFIIFATVIYQDVIRQHPTLYLALCGFIGLFAALGWKNGKRN